MASEGLEKVLEYIIRYSFDTENVELSLSRQIFFSRRFMKWNATIIVTFFNPHELTKIVPKSFTKFYGPNWIIWPSELNQKGFSSFFA